MDSDQSINQTARLNRWSAWAIVAAAISSAILYLSWSAASGVWGFALDDAWIHQTYARNLIATGQFAFVPGQTSAGSTSPLWTLLIALGYLVHANYHWWTYALGTACLVLTALGVWRLSLQLFPEHPLAAFAAGILCAIEWHMLWAAVSGMETVVFTALAIWLLVAANHLSHQADVRRSIVIGLLCGLLVLTRPEGLLLAALVLLAQSFRGGWKRRATWSRLAATLIGMIVLLTPWVIFNWRASGTAFPNTFYAKQREYASVLAMVPFSQRLGQVFLAPFIGAQVLLVPGILISTWTFARRWQDTANWIKLVPIIWAVAHLALYALRLPVTYQHGRYQMPVISVLIAFGIGGTASLLRWNDLRLWPRVASRAATLAMALTAMAFITMGARAYAADVAIIEGEMVRVARWLDANTAPGDLIAAHDIGAIGYFARRPLVDLAGLISPEVIPFIRDESRLEALLQERRAAYLVTFPSWYPRMTQQPNLTPLFTGNATGSPEHMTVYRLDAP